MSRLFHGVRAPSALGTFLRTFTFGHVRQLDSVAKGADYGSTGVKGLNALIATVSSPLAAPLIIGTRLRRGLGEQRPRRQPG